VLNFHPYKCPEGQLF